MQSESIFGDPETQKVWGDQTPYEEDHWGKQITPGMKTLLNPDLFQQAVRRANKVHTTEFSIRKKRWNGSDETVATMKDTVEKFRRILLKLESDHSCPLFIHIGTEEVLLTTEQEEGVVLFTPKTTPPCCEIKRDLYRLYFADLIKNLFFELRWNTERASASFDVKIGMDSDIEQKLLSYLVRL